MHYTFTFTPRMVLIAGVCLILLCVLLFLAGMEIGEQMAAPGSSLASKLPGSLPVSDKALEAALPKAPKLPTAEDLIKPLVPEKK